MPLQQTLRHQSRAFNNFFARRARYPRFKSRRGRKTATYTRSAFRYRDGQLFLAKQTGPLRFVWSWTYIDQDSIVPSMVTVTHDADGRWYVTFQLNVEDPQPLPKTGNVVGVDVGIRSFAATSDGEVLDNPRLLQRKQCNLARYQRRIRNRHAVGGVSGLAARVGDRDDRRERAFVIGMRAGHGKTAATLCDDCAAGRRAVSPIDARREIAGGGVRQAGGEGSDR